MTRDEAVRFAFAELHQTFFDALHALMAKVDARARAEEREACAKVLEENAKACVKDFLMYKVLMSNAMAIRARGEK